jgi:hypothetical protein
MFQIYYNDDVNIKIIAFAKTMVEAIKKLQEITNNFIIENEGIKKLESSYISQDYKKEELKDGYYFIKESNTNIKLLNKKTTIDQVSGWLSTNQIINHQIDIIGSYNIIEFPDHLLNEYIDNKDVVKKVNNIPKKLEEINNKNNFNEIIKELKLKFSNAKIN